MIPPDSTSSPVETRRIRELEIQLRTEAKKSALVRDVSRALSAGLGLNELLSLIMEKVTQLMEADRSTLYLLTEDGQELWSKVLQGGDAVVIRLAVGEGIAGWVAKSGEIVNIEDAYTDTRFQPEVDYRSGYRTRSILCGPMRDNHGVIIGVLQVLNKKGGGPFTADDEELLLALASQAAVAIENAKLYHSVVDKNRELTRAQEALQQRTDELNVLYEIEKLMNADHDLKELLQKILFQAMAAVGVRSGVIALRDDDSSELEFLTVAGPFSERMEGVRIAMGQGIVGWVAAHDQAILVNDPKSDARHVNGFAKTYDLDPRNIACAPLRGGKVLGSIELMDKIEPDDQGNHQGFAENDLKLLVLIAGQAAKAIELSQARAARSKEERLASIGRMLAGVLHDLKTPMTIISGYAQLMAQIEDAQQREAYVNQILRQFDLMAGMTREVLGFARGETEILVRRVYLHKFLEEVATQLNHALAGRRITLQVDAQFRETAYFDQQKIMRVLHNLARNAADAMPDGGKLIIATRLDPQDSKMLMIEVEDNGQGIPPELEGKLFEMFSTGRQGGTGLGLAIVKKIVDEHHGTITYATKAGQGTRFSIRIPRERPETVVDRSELPTVH